MDLSALGFLIAVCSLLVACSWVLHLDHLPNICVSWWKLFPTIFARRSSAAALPLPPGSFGLPWLGETVQFNNALQAGDLHPFLKHRTARFGSKTFKTHIFLKPTAIVQGATANRFLATSENQHLLVNSWATSVLRIVGQHAPPAKQGAAHRRLRHIISSCLCPLALRKLVGKADLLTRHHFASCWKGQSHLNLIPVLKLHTFRIACNLLASIEDEAVISRLYPLFNTWLAGMVALPINLPGTAFHKALKARNALVQEMGNIIHRRRKDLAHLEESKYSEPSSGEMETCTVSAQLDAGIISECTNDNTSTVKGVNCTGEHTTDQSDVLKDEHTFGVANEDRSSCVASAQRGNNISNKYTEDLLSILIKARDADGGSLNQEELQDVLLFILFAGHDTTTATLAFALKFLEQNPACYDTLVQEHKSIDLQKSVEEDLKWEDVQEMKYTWRVIQETMRIMPPVFGGLKEATQNLTFDGYQIPKGWKMFFSMTNTHHDEKYFSEPSKFDPSRFDTKKRQGESTPPPFAYVPFGIGPHSCPGNEFARMTISIYLHHLVRNFKWDSMEPNEKVCIFPMPTLTKGYPIKILEKIS